VEHPPVALVVALAQERRALQCALASVRHWRTGEFRALVGRGAGQAVVVIQAGIGRERARRAVLTASHRFPFRGAWSLGFAGGLAEGLAPGDLVCPAVVLQDDGRAGKSWGMAPGQATVSTALSAAGTLTHDGPLLTVDVPLRSPRMKRAAHQRTGAVAVDMEAVGVVEAARSLGIPWLAMKAVVDVVEEPLPEFLGRCTTPRGDLRWRGILWALSTRGENRRTLWRSGLASRRASLGLQRALEVSLLAWSP
jgi:nucleoside phosphorylase